jgi:predicted ATPase
MLLKDLEINNFRGLRKLSWKPLPGINCLVGPGDSGKSSILDAIDLVLSARRQVSFTDADFYCLDVTKPIEIKATLGELPDVLKDFDLYGMYHRGWNPETATIEAEPGVGLEAVLTIVLTVGPELEPNWSLYSERAAAQSMARDFTWAHRTEVAATRLGAYAAQHFAWGNRSILNRLSDDRAKAAEALAAASRVARKSFEGKADPQVQKTLTIVGEVAAEIGVSTSGALQALLDVQGISFAGGSVALHDGQSVPLRSLGLGSARLLVAGMQKRAAANTHLILIDEIELGLEPFRIVRLLHILGAKDKNQTGQVFMTTHSPIVLRELSAGQLRIIRETKVTDPTQPSHIIYSVGAGEAEQSTLRACAEAFLTPSVIVCEGKTEIGLVRGLDLFQVENGKLSMTAHGVYYADGGGSQAIGRALVFSQLGYRTILFRDGDQPITPEQVEILKNAKIEIVEWTAGHATEDVLFASIPSEQIQQLLILAVSRCGKDAIDAHIKQASNADYGLEEAQTQFNDAMRSFLATAAKKKRWFKDVEPGEIIGREIVGPHLADCDTSFVSVLTKIEMWVKPQTVPIGTEG